jgi:uncharacterized protein (TIGR02145 family)
MLSAVCMATSFVSFAQVGIGTNNPQSILEIVSPNNGLILPRVANTAAVTSPVNGMFIYDISTECVKAYENNRWTDCLEKNDAAPVASAVSINGATVVEEILAGMYTYTDADADTQGASIYKWYRADDATGTNQTIIAGATNNSYTLTEMDKTKYIAFEVTPVARTGTATTGLTVVSPYIGPVISYKDETTVIQDITLSISGQIWMDRNLGATIAASTYFSTDPDTFGDLYQWGRRKDGHQDRNNTATSTAQATGSIANNGGAFFIDTSTANSNDFYGMSWTTFTGNNLWEDGVNDPCPTGYRVPTKLEWAAINPLNEVEITLPDYNEYEELNLPSNYEGLVGYWSSTKYENDPNHAYAFVTNVQQVSFGSLIKAHSEALGVRCIKITAGAGPEVSALSISGNLVIGETVTATYTYTDINNDPEGASTFKWFRANDA